MYVLLRMILGMLIGIACANAGLTLSDWEFWAILLGSVAVGLVSYCEGLLDD